MRSKEQSQLTNSNTCFLPGISQYAESDTTRKAALRREDEPLTYSCSRSSMPSEGTSKLSVCSESQSSETDIVSRPNPKERNFLRTAALTSSDDTLSQPKTMIQQTVGIRMLPTRQTKKLPRAPHSNLKRCEEVFASSPSTGVARAPTSAGSVDQTNVKHRSSQLTFRATPFRGLRNPSHAVRKNSKRQLAWSQALHKSPIKENKTPQFRDFVEEIRRNNLVMKEEIYSSSDLKTSPTSFDHGDREICSTRDSLQSVAREVSQLRPAPRDVEVYESGGSRADCGDSRKPDLSTIQLSVPKAAKPETVEELLDEELPVVVSKDWEKTAGRREPMNRMSKYVQLPGFPEAFDQRDSYVRDLRINSGASFVSSSGLRGIAVGKTAHEDRPIDNVAAFKKQAAEGSALEPKPREEVTGRKAVMKNCPTQTTSSFDTHRADEGCCSNQEILICTDDGQGVQLYDELFRPLTDSDGYLLKDNQGKFLVQLNHYGAPVSSKERKQIFLEDKTEWEAAKGSLNIVLRQTRRKLTSPIGQNVEERRRGSNDLQDQAFGQVEKELPSFSLRSKIEKQCKHKSHTPSRMGVSASLMSDMISITELRNLLLERIKRIANRRESIEQSILSSGRRKYSYQVSGNCSVSRGPRHVAHPSELASECRGGVVPDKLTKASPLRPHTAGHKSDVQECSRESRSRRRLWDTSTHLTMLAHHVLPAETTDTDHHSTSMSWKRRSSYPPSTWDRYRPADRHSLKLRGLTVGQLPDQTAN